MNIRKTINKIVNNTIKESTGSSGDPVPDMVEAIGYSVSNAVEFILQDNLDLIQDHVADELSLDSDTWFEGAMELSPEDISAVSNIVTQKTLSSKELHNIVHRICVNVVTDAISSMDEPSIDYDALAGVRGAKV